MIFLQLFCKSKITFKKPKVEKLHFTPPALPTHAPGVNHCELSVCLYTLFLSVYKYVYSLVLPPFIKNKINRYTLFLQLAFFSQSIKDILVSGQRHLLPSLHQLHVFPLYHCTGLS